MRESGPPGLFTDPSWPLSSAWLALPFCPLHSGNWNSSRVRVCGSYSHFSVGRKHPESSLLSWCWSPNLCFGPSSTFSPPHTVASRCCQKKKKIRVRVDVWWPWAAGTPLPVTITLCNYLVVLVVVVVVLFFCSNLTGHCTDKRAVILAVGAWERQFRLSRKFEPAHYLGDTGVLKPPCLEFCILAPRFPLSVIP